MNYVRSVQGPPGRWQVSINGGIIPRWKQQNEILYMEANKIMRVSVQTEPAFSAGTPEALFAGHYLEMDVFSDHQRFVLTLPRQKTSDYLNVVIHWFDEVRKRAPLAN